MEFGFLKMVRSMRVSSGEIWLMELACTMGRKKLLKEDGNRIN